MLLFTMLFCFCCNLFHDDISDFFFFFVKINCPNLQFYKTKIHSQIAKTKELAVYH